MARPSPGVDDAFRFRRLGAMSLLLWFVFAGEDSVRSTMEDARVVLRDLAFPISGGGVRSMKSSNGSGDSLPATRYCEIAGGGCLRAC